ncbi:TetR family transcriptional regulator [Microbacterium sp. AG1240]|uniref:TetR/AcrR family transcriptional regulator n=1 Tax=Microbacterium sp. AG1240 TaxID=2183992 RepID=UPI000EAFA5AA|nr:TetR/AcrR family transcriptional regulator [Microbacterium sp. AG1240]RKT31315.1 TetR family transcriptional regulator [Microbacterium sp. AG1240]
MALRTRTETKLLDAADELFFTRGIAATPIDAVLERAGVSAATLYRGYSSKDALVAAALDRRHAAWIETWDAAVAAQTTDEGRLLAIFDALDVFRSQPAGSRWCAFLGSAAEYADAPPEVDAAIHRDSDSMRARLTDLAASVDPARAAALADQLMLVVTGDLAMRLRSPAHTSGVARGIAAALVAG